MSAVAAVVSKQGAVLLSDGITFRIPDDLHVHDNLKRSDFEIVHTNRPKIFKVNDRVGVSWVGNVIPEIQDQIPQCAETPNQVAGWLSEQLKSYHKGEEYLLGRDNYNIKAAVTGYDRQGTPWGFDVRSHTGFSVEGMPLQGLQTFCSIPFMEGNDSMRRFNKLLDEYNDSKRAFTEMVRDYEAQDHIVGGEIFSFTLSP